MDRACAALISLTAAGEDAVDGREHADLVELASDDLAELVSTPDGLAALLRLLDIAINFGAQVADQSPSFVARLICNVAQQADREDPS
jgi:hypothetical protein